MPAKINNINDLGRRGLLKRFALGAGTLTFLKISPMAAAQSIESVPAITSLLLEDECNAGGVCNETNRISLEYRELSGNTFDADFEIVTPGGSRITPKSSFGVLEGGCGLVHQGDMTSDGGNVTETISRANTGVSSVAPGRYQLFVRSNSSGTVQITSTIGVRFCGLRTGVSGALTLPPMQALELGSLNVAENGQASFRILGATGSNF